MAAIEVLPGVRLDEAAIAESFIRASGPGGQNVNKLATAVQLRLDIAASGLPEAVRTRLTRLAGRRVSQEGVLLIAARRHRTQERNREAAMEALLDLIRRAAAPPPPKRVPTRPGRAAKERRLETKSRRGATKRLRGRPAEGN
ncbi:MAG: aminoacyl-tRNA hydrolase [Rhodospirillales bacterium]|nr:aminoacyl-tRNA hydrolase [Rhodospirillales bacterium]